MFNMMKNLGISQDETDASFDRQTGLPAGISVMTSDGAIPVEYLNPGDRIVARSGMATLRAINVGTLTNIRPVQISAGALGHDRPDHTILMPPGQRVFLRDWRAQVIFGADSVAVPVAKLLDGSYVKRLDELQDLRVIRLCFDAPEVIYAEGLEVLIKETAPSHLYS
jgi:hypothetical protein